MDNQNHVTGNEQIENEEQAINEPINILEQGESVDMRTVYEKSNEELDELV